MPPESEIPAGLSGPELQEAIGERVGREFRGYTLAGADDAERSLLSLLHMIPRKDVLASAGDAFTVTAFLAAAKEILREGCTESRRGNLGCSPACTQS